MRKIRYILLALVLALASVGAAAADNPDFTAHLSGGNEVPPNTSRAAGQAIFHFSDDGATLHYKLIAANINNVVAAHIHLAPAGANGPVVLFLYGPAAPGQGRSSGVLATGTATAADLVGPLAGASLDDLLAEIVAGNAYVNVHTNDGIDPPNTGPGDFPGGEIRGQIR